MTHRLLLLLALLAVAPIASAQDGGAAFDWPDGKRAALSLTFDDARASQIDTGLPLFARHGAAVTFYVLPGAVEARLDGWKQAAAAGHEIANHSLVHPCSGTFRWSRDRALEDYSIEQMRGELLEANRLIAELVGTEPETFAYPCGQTFIGRGRQTESYVPLVAELFLAGRGWLDEAPNDPNYTDLSQVTGMSMDAAGFDQILPLLQAARETGDWVVLVGHDIGVDGRQTTRIDMLEALLRYALAPEAGFWLAPVGTVARHIVSRRTPESFGK